MKGALVSESLLQDRLNHHLPMLREQEINILCVGMLYILGSFCFHSTYLTIIDKFTDSKLATERSLMSPLSKK